MFVCRDLPTPLPLVPVLPDMKPAAAPPTDTGAQRRSTAGARAPRPADDVDTRYLQSLLGYNARRAALAVIGVFIPRMAAYGLRPVDFSILSVIRHNGGITSKQLCTALNLLPPNLVGKIGALQKRGLVERRPHPTDGRALGLHLTERGQMLAAQAELAAFELENEVASPLTPAERKTLIKLLQKVYEA